MSELRVNNIVSEDGSTAPIYSKGMSIGAGQTLTCTGDLNVSGNATFNSGATISGIVTFSDVNLNTNLNVVGILTAASGSFGGNVSVGGTLTYEDVTNIDSVGIVTARTGIKVLANGLDVTGPYKENITAVGALDIDCSAGNYFTKTITTGTNIFTFSNVPTGCLYAFVIELTHTGGTAQWPSSVKFPSDTPPTLTTGKTHLFFFLTDNNGTTFKASTLVDYVN